jgi:GntR family transcriptional regulator
LLSCLDNFTHPRNPARVLNPASPLPLYQQLAEQLSRQIESGALAEGARLPSEPELSRRHRIGRPTVRQATELLVKRGLVERRRGAGTFVRAEPRKVDLLSLGGTLSSFRAGGVALTTKLVGKVVARRVEPSADNPFSERMAFVLTRLGRVEEQPVLLERLYFDPELFPGLDALPLSGASLSRVVEERYYLKPTHAEQSFRALLPDDELKQLLELSSRTPLLLVRRALFFPNAARAVYCELFCRTDTLVFSQTIGAEVPT